MRIKVKAGSNEVHTGATETPLQGLQASVADRHRIHMKVKIDPDPHQQFQIRIDVTSRTRVKIMRFRNTTGMRRVGRLSLY
jgi:hypothetical protein